MLAEPVTHITKVLSGSDRYGKPVYIDSPVEILAIAFAPDETTESHSVNEVTVTSRGTLYTKPGLLVSPEDEFIVRGNRFQVDGELAVWKTIDRHPGDVTKLTRTVITRG